MCVCVCTCVWVWQGYRRKQEWGWGKGRVGRQGGRWQLVSSTSRIASLLPLGPFTHDLKPRIALDSRVFEQKRGACGIQPELAADPDTCRALGPFP